MRASAVLDPTPQLHWDRPAGDKENPSLSVTCRHNYPHRPVSAPETLILGSCHQAEEKTPRPHFLPNSCAFTETSILCEQRGVSSHSPGVDFTLKHEEEFALRSSIPVNTERLWSHSPWSSQDPHGRLLNLHGWRGSVGKQCVYQMAWNQIPGQVRLSEARVSALTAPTSYPCPSQLSPSSSQSLGLSSGLNPAQLLLPFPVPVTVTVMRERTDAGVLHVDPTDKST